MFGETFGIAFGSAAGTAASKFKVMVSDEVPKGQIWVVDKLKVVVVIKNIQETDGQNIK